MKYEVNLTVFAAVAMNHCLSQVEPKGRSEVRNHSRNSRALRESCFIEEKGETRAKAGKIVLDEDREKYIEELTEAQIKKGIPGNLSVGYDDLSEALENCEEIKETEKIIKLEKEKKA